MGAFVGQPAVSLVVIVLVVGFAIAYGIWRGGEILSNLRQPMVTREARVLRKHVREDQGTGWDPATTYLITFHLESGEQRAGRVSRLGGGIRASRCRAVRPAEQPWRLVSRFPPARRGVICSCVAGHLPCAAV